VIEIVTHDGRDLRNEEYTALYALLAGAYGCRLLARSARLAHDDGFADFLERCRWRSSGGSACSLCSTWLSRGY
jgi:hypothetical protein